MHKQVLSWWDTWLFCFDTVMLDILKKRTKFPNLNPYNYMYYFVTCNCQFYQSINSRIFETNFNIHKKQQHKMAQTQRTTQTHTQKRSTHNCTYMWDILDKMVLLSCTAASMSTLIYPCAGSRPVVAMETIVAWLDRDLI